MSYSIVQTVDKPPFNLGLCLLRTYMCFNVVLIHCWNGDISSQILKGFVMFKGCAVPVFMFMSFDLAQNVLVSGSIERIRKRLWRLIWPMFGWAILYWVIYRVVEIYSGAHILNGMSDMLWQMFTGASFNPTMWYQSVLILISVVFFCLFYFLPVRGGICCIGIFFVLSLIMQYSGINYALFSEMRSELKWPLGRTCEMIPYAVLGFYFSYYGIDKKLERRRGVALLSSVALIFLIFKSPIMPTAEGFYYSGIRSIGIAVFLTIFAMLLPFHKVPEWIRSVIMMLSRYTLGIYCMHLLVAYFVRLIYDKIGLEKNTFSMCVLVYILCYIISAVIAKIPFKLCRMLVE